MYSISKIESHTNQTDIQKIPTAYILFSAPNTDQIRHNYAQNSRIKAQRIHFSVPLKYTKNEKKQNGNEVTCRSMNQIHEEEKHEKAQILTLLPSTATFAPALPDDNFSTTTLLPVIPKPKMRTPASNSWFFEFLQTFLSFYNHSAIHIIYSMNTIYLYSNTFKPLQSKT